MLLSVIAIFSCASFHLRFSGSFYHPHRAFEIDGGDDVVPLSFFLGFLRRCLTLLILTIHFLAGSMENLVGRVAVQIHGIVVFRNVPAELHYFIHSYVLLISAAPTTFARTPLAAS